LPEALTVRIFPTEQEAEMAVTRRAENVPVDADLLDEARALNVDLSRAAEMGIARAVRAEQAARKFAEEYPDVVRSNNEYVAKHGLPLEKYRLF